MVKVGLTFEEEFGPEEGDDEPEDGLAVQLPVHRGPVNRKQVLQGLDLVPQLVPVPLRLVTVRKRKDKVASKGLSVTYRMSGKQRWDMPGIPPSLDPVTQLVSVYVHITVEKTNGESFTVLLA